MTIAVLESALAENDRPPELQKHDTAGRRIRQTADNGTVGRTVLTDIGAVDPAAPQHRNRTFDRTSDAKGQTRLEANKRIITPED